MNPAKNKNLTGTPPRNIAMKIKSASNLSWSVSAVILSFACLTAFAQDYRILHHFTGGSNDGSGPLGSLIQSGSTLYGMTRVGGSYDNGTIFKINTEGTGFQLLRSFVSASSDGQRPYGSLLLSGSSLFGMAAAENTTYGGTLFQIDTNGTGFQVLHRFGGPRSDGRWPYDSLIQSGPTLYGMTVAGGRFDNSGSCWGGTVFQINTNGTGYQMLHQFSGGSTDGQWSPGNLTQSGSTLYGMTYGGGSSGLGTAFKLNTDGTGFQLLHSFAGGSNDGSRTHGSLLLSGSMLYGMTYGRGTIDKGTVFTMNTNGAGFQLLHSFTGATNDGSQPLGGALVQSGSTLYGMTDGGGTSNNGVVFQIKTDGTGFQLLHSFAGGTGDGSGPVGAPFLSGSTLYGMTSQGGSNNLGVIFALDLLPTLAITPSDTNIILSWSTNFPDLVLESTDQLAGAWTPVPGVTGYSTTLPINPEANQFFRLRK